jgi:hypothetical protein
MTMFFAFGFHELRAGPGEKTYVPEIVITYGIDLSYGLDAATTVQEATFREIVGEDILILNVPGHAMLTGDKMKIQENKRMVSDLDNKTSIFLEMPGITDINRHIQKEGDYSMLGNSKRSLNRLNKTDRKTTCKNYSQLGYSIKY